FARLYPKVLIVNYTYKTNKYKIPLLNIVNINAIGSTFYIIFIYLSGKEKEDFA
ncbi:hypothetical protein FOC4_g10005612, partial [Fusarium odoratissimum]